MDRDTPGREQTLRFLAAPTDAGYSGSVGGGRVLEWIDKAGYACAVGWSGRYCVTAYVGNVRFTRPVAVGDLVEATARLVYTGRSSMHILVTVRSGSPRGHELAPATECLMVFVAVDDDGRPTPVPELPEGDDEDLVQKAGAVRRIDLRAEISAAMAEQSYTEASTAPSVVLRFLAAPTDVNWGGKVHGGIVMRWIDEAAHVLVTQWTGEAGNVAVYAGGVRFYQPLRIGDLVEVEARLIYTGRTSMHVSVHVRSGRAAGMERRLTTHCLIVFVALTPEGTSVEARPWEPTTEEDVNLFEHAQHLIALRTAVDEVDPAPA
ncbi:MAG: hotdog domain-containing protein [Lapillicoccus sp.]